MIVCFNFYPWVIINKRIVWQALMFLIEAKATLHTLSFGHNQVHF